MFAAVQLLFRYFQIFGTLQAFQSARSRRKPMGMGRANRKIKQSTTTKCSFILNEGKLERIFLVPIKSKRGFGIKNHFCK